MAVSPADGGRWSAAMVQRQSPGATTTVVSAGGVRVVVGAASGLGGRSGGGPADGAAGGAGGADAVGVRSGPAGGGTGADVLGAEVVGAEVVGAAEGRAPRSGGRKPSVPLSEGGAAWATAAA